MPKERSNECPCCGGAGWCRQVGLWPSNTSLVVMLCVSTTSRTSATRATAEERRSTGVRARTFGAGQLSGLGLQTTASNHASAKGAWRTSVTDIDLWMGICNGPACRTNLDHHERRWAILVSAPVLC